MCFHYDGSKECCYSRTYPFLYSLIMFLCNDMIQGVAFGYPGCSPLFHSADFGLTSKSRVVLLGENGNGKTTLVKLMLGELQPTVSVLVSTWHMTVFMHCLIVSIHAHTAERTSHHLSAPLLRCSLSQQPRPLSATAVLIIDHFSFVFFSI